MGILSNLLRSYSGTENEKPVNEVSSASTAAVNAPASTPSSSQVQHAVDNVTQSEQSITALQSRLTPASQATGIDESNPRHRVVKQLTVYFTGCAFLAGSVLLTRKAVRRRILTVKPGTFTPSNFKSSDTNGAVEAAEALALATINVGSFGLMLTGGAMYAFDVVSVEDLRYKFRRRMGFDQSDLNKQNADQEIEEWVKSMLDKKDGGDSKSITEGLTALVGVLAGREEEKLEQEKTEEISDDLD